MLQIFFLKYYFYKGQFLGHIPKKIFGEVCLQKSCSLYTVGLQFTNFLIFLRTFQTLLSIIFHSIIQKQLSRGVLMKRYKNMQQIYRRTPMPKCDLKLLCNFIEIAFQHGCSLVNLLDIFRTPSPKNTSRGLLLTFICVEK